MGGGGGRELFKPEVSASHFYTVSWYSCAHHHSPRHDAKLNITLPKRCPKRCCAGFQVFFFFFRARCPSCSPTTNGHRAPRATQRSLTDGHLKRRKKQLLAEKEAAEETVRLAKEAKIAAETAKRPRRFDVSDDAIRAGLVGVAFLAGAAAVFSD